MQKARVNSIVEDLGDRACYCDSACLAVGDCCHDYADTCKGELSRNLCQSLCVSLRARITAIARMVRRRVSDLRFAPVPTWAAACLFLAILSTRRSSSFTAPRPSLAVDFFALAVVLLLSDRCAFLADGADGLLGRREAQPDAKIDVVLPARQSAPATVDAVCETGILRL